MKLFVPSPTGVGEYIEHEVPDPEPFVYDPDIHYVHEYKIEVGPFLDVLNWETREHVYRYKTKNATAICCKCCDNVLIKDADLDEILGPVPTAHSLE